MPVAQASAVAVGVEAAVSEGMVLGCTAGTVEDAGCVGYGSAMHRIAVVVAASSAWACYPLSARIV